MVEATEELVRVYLEQNGYLVTASKKVDVKTSRHAPRAEIDIIAIKIKDDKTCNLPLRIAGEVKSFIIDQRGFKELDDKLRQEHGYVSRPEFGRYKWVNDKNYRKNILDSLEKEYNYPDFKFVLFCSGIQPKYEKEIRDYLKKEEIYIVKHRDIIKWLYNNITDEYTDNQIMQLIRLIKQNATIQF